MIEREPWESEQVRCILRRFQLKACKAIRRYSMSDANEGSTLITRTGWHEIGFQSHFLVALPKIDR